tara:strand:- start:1528 stop:1986 length:459 start_codon:yes stop_codon:yes gene_type:complete
MTVPTTFDGAIISLSADNPAAYTASGFADAGVITYAVLGEVINLPEIGRVYTDVSYNSLAVRGTRHTKGSYEEPEIPIEIGVDRLDAGQIILKTALNSDASFSFKVAYGNGEIDFFLGKVFSLVSAGGDNNTTRVITANVRIDHQGVVEVPA